VHASVWQNCKGGGRGGLVPGTFNRLFFYRNNSQNYFPT